MSVAPPGRYDDGDNNLRYWGGANRTNEIQPLAPTVESSPLDEFSTDLSARVNKSLERFSGMKIFGLTSKLPELPKINSSFFGGKKQATMLLELIAAERHERESLLKIMRSFVMSLKRLRTSRRLLSLWLKNGESPLLDWRSFSFKLAKQQ